MKRHRSFGFSLSFFMLTAIWSAGCGKTDSSTLKPETADTKPTDAKPISSEGTTSAPDIAAIEQRLSDYDKQSADFLPSSQKFADLRKARSDYLKQVAPQLTQLLLTRKAELQSLLHDMVPTAPAVQGKRAEVDRVERILELDIAKLIGISFVSIPAGEFDMGSPSTEAHRRDDEGYYGRPYHVRIMRPFLMAIHDITRAQFAAFVDDTGYKTDAENAAPVPVQGDGKLVTLELSWRNPGFKQGDDHPAVMVTWNDASAFCAWLSKKQRKHCRLPTEQEWEYACRAGTTTAYPWGDSPDDGKGWANCGDQSLKKALQSAPADMDFFNWDDGYAVTTSPVGKFKPNGWGLYDMIGNAGQWCDDCYVSYGNSINPTTMPTNFPRVIRGGGFTASAQLCRAAMRMGHSPDLAYPSDGFRICMDP